MTPQDLESIKTRPATEEIAVKNCSHHAIYHKDKSCADLNDEDINKCCRFCLSTKEALDQERAIIESLLREVEHHRESTIDGDCQACDYDSFQAKIAELQQEIEIQDKQREELVDIHIKEENRLQQENSRLKKQWLLEPDQTLPEGFWGRSCARLQKKLSESKEESQRYRTALENLKRQNHHTIEEEMWRIDEALQGENKL